MKRHLAPTMTLALLTTLALTSCGSSAESAESAQEGADATPSPDQEPAEEREPSERETSEAAGPSPRLAVTYDGGVAILDGATLEVIDEFSAEGFLRVNPAGDGRHVFLTEGEGFRLIDAGTWGEPHGDHNHYYTTDPFLSDVTVDGETPGHVVAHDGIGALFFDGSGEIHSFDLSALDVEADELTTEVSSTEEAHHGVAVVFSDGSRYETIGDEETRSGARVLDAQGEEIARSEDCPGVHGEAAGPEGTIVVGCEDGVLVWDGEEFEKIDAESDYARIGNLFPHEDSSVMLGDYNLDEDGEEPMTEVALIDTASGEIATSELDAPYNFRSLARGPEGEALVLAEDGQLHVIEPETGEHEAHIQVVDEWTEPEEWQEPRPAINVIGDIAYITEPATQELHMVDLAAGEVINSVELGFEPNELTGVDGRTVEGVSEESDAEHGSDQEDAEHDHDHDHADDEDHDHADDEDHDH